MQFSMRLEIYSLIDVSRIFIAQPHRRLHVHMYIYIYRDDMCSSHEMRMNGEKSFTYMIRSSFVISIG